MTNNFDLSHLLRQAEEGYSIDCRHGKIVDLNARSSCGDTLLHVAVSRRSFDEVKFLVDSGLDINAQGDFFETPLHLASILNDPEMVKLLLDLGADPSIPDHLGRSVEKGIE